MRQLCSYFLFAHFASFAANLVNYLLYKTSCEEVATIVLKCFLAAWVQQTNWGCRFMVMCYPDTRQEVHMDSLGGAAIRLKGLFLKTYLTVPNNNFLQITSQLQSSVNPLTTEFFPPRQHIFMHSAHTTFVGTPLPQHSLLSGQTWWGPHTWRDHSGNTVNDIHDPPQAQQSEVKGGCQPDFRPAFP